MAAYPDGRLAVMGSDARVRTFQAELLVPGIANRTPVVYDLTDEVPAIGPGSIHVTGRGELLVYYGIFSPVLIVSPNPSTEPHEVLPLGATPAVFEVATNGTTDRAVASTVQGVYTWIINRDFSTAVRLPDAEGRNYSGVTVLDDDSVAAIHRDGYIDVWAAPYDTAPRRLLGAIGTDLVALADGRMISGNFTVKQLWDVRSTAGPRFPGHGQAVTAVAAMPDGRIATGDVAGDVYIWDRDNMASPTVIRNRTDQAVPEVRALTGIEGDRLAIAIGTEVWVHDLKEPEYNLQYNFSEQNLEAEAMVANPEGFLAVHNAERLFVLNVTANVAVASANFVPDGFFNDIDSIDGARFVSVDGTDARIVDPVARIVTVIPGLEAVDPLRVKVLDDGRFVFGEIGIRPPVIYDPTGASGLVEMGVPGIVVGQRDDGRLVLQQLGGEFVVVDLADTSRIVERITQVGTTDDVTSVFGNSLLGANANGWVLFE